MLLSCDDDLTVASAEAVMIVGSKRYGSSIGLIIYQCILAPNGLSIVRMSPPNLLYLSVSID